MDFKSKVLASTQKIPRGNVASYKDIARLAGHKGAYRAVGNALACNARLIEIPCHRVVCSNGELGGFQKGAAFKKRLLAGEGIVFDKKGRIHKKFFIKLRMLHKLRKVADVAATSATYAT